MEGSLFLFPPIDPDRKLTSLTRTRKKINGKILLELGVTSKAVKGGKQQGKDFAPIDSGKCG